MNTIDLKIDLNSGILFQVQDKWIMRLTPDGIKFNRHDFPDLTENDFAEEIIKIMENNFKIKFEK